MIEIIPTGEKRIVAVCIDGRIEGADLDRITALVEEKLRRHDRLRIYVEVRSLGGVSLEALVKDLKLGLGNLRHFERKAVVSDKPWMEALARYADRLFPAIELKHFAPDQRAAAMAWLEAG